MEAILISNPPCLTLFDWRVETQDEVHLPAIFVRQKENAQYRIHRDFVIERFSVKLNECRKDLDVIATCAEKNGSGLKINPLSPLDLKFKMIYTVINWKPE